MVALNGLGSLYYVRIILGKAAASALDVKLRAIRPLNFNRTATLLTRTFKAKHVFVPPSMVLLHLKNYNQICKQKTDLSETSHLFEV
jgi:hypothetical protein